jgi:PAS domain S-box-containing protein
MSLGTKAVAVLGALAAALLLVLAAVQIRLVRAGFARVEQGYGHENAARVLRAVERCAEDLDTVAADWASWDEMYAFAQDRNHGFAQANIAPEFMKAPRIHLLLVVDAAGAVVGGAATAPQSLAARPIPADLSRLVAAAGSPLADAVRGRRSAAGLLLLAEGPLMLAARPILTRKGQGPARGAVIMGRFLDAAELQRISEGLRLQVGFFRADALPARPELKAVLADLVDADTTEVRVLDPATLASYGVVRDLQAKPALVIEVRMPRDIYREGLRLSHVFSAILLLAGGVFVIAVAVLLRLTVVSRLEYLSREVSRVTASEAPTSLVALPGTDELAALAQNINRMLARSAESRRALVESEARYRRLFNTVPVGLYSTTPDGERLDGNPAMMEVLGCADREAFMKGKSVGAYARLDDRRRWHDLVLRNGVVRDCEVQLWRHDGALVWGLLSAQTVCDEAGRTVAYEGSFVDITARKLAEAALRESEERFREIAESVTDWVWEVDASGLYTYASPAVERILGYRSAEIVGTRRFQDLLVPVGGRALNPSILGAMSRQERIRSLVGVHAHQDGHAVLLETNATPVRNSDGTFLGYRGAGTDVTERQQAEASLRQHQKMAAIGMLASGVAHQINNPIFGVMNYALLIADGLGAESPLRDYANGIVQETQRVADIVGSLLAFSRPEEDGRRQSRMADVVGATLSMIQAALCRDQIALHVAVPEGLPTIRCRSRQIQHVLMNLLTNAREALNARYPKYHPDKAIWITATVFIRGGKTWVRTTVEDHGGGVSEENHDRLFDPFFTTKDRVTSAGLGLPVSLGLTKAEGGTLHFESEVDHYTRFHVDLPAEMAGGEVGDEVAGEVGDEVIGEVTGEVGDDVGGDAIGDVGGDAIGDVGGDVIGDVGGDVGGDLTGDVGEGEALAGRVAGRR